MVRFFSRQTNLGRLIPVESLQVAQRTFASEPNSDPATWAFFDGTLHDVFSDSLCLDLLDCWFSETLKIDTAFSDNNVFQNFENPKQPKSHILIGLAMVCER